jgi:hypothetical protein
MLQGAKSARGQNKGSSPPFPSLPLPLLCPFTPPPPTGQMCNQQGGWRLQQGGSTPPPATRTLVCYSAWEPSSGRSRDTAAISNSDGNFPEMFTGGKFPGNFLYDVRASFFSRLFFNRFIYVTVIL